MGEQVMDKEKTKIILAGLLIVFGICLIIASFTDKAVLFLFSVIVVPLMIIGFSEARKEGSFGIYPKEMAKDLGLAIYCIGINFVGVWILTIGCIALPKLLEILISFKVAPILFFLIVNVHFSLFAGLSLACFYGMYSLICDVAELQEEEFEGVVENPEEIEEVMRT